MSSVRKNSIDFTNPKHQTARFIDLDFLKFVPPLVVHSKGVKISLFLELSNSTRNYVGTTCRNIIVVHANDDHNREKMLKKVREVF